MSSITLGEEEGKSYIDKKIWNAYIYFCFSIIAVNYPARDKGVTRHMRGNEAKEKCPDIVLARVPEVRGKADLTKYVCNTRQDLF